MLYAFELKSCHDEKSQHKESDFAKCIELIAIKDQN